MYNPFGLPMMYNPLGPWNTWLAVSSQPARIWAGMLRGIMQGWSQPDAETDRIISKNLGPAEPDVPASANEARRDGVAKKALELPAQRARRNGHRVRSSRVDHRIKKIKKGRPSPSGGRSNSKAARRQRRGARAE
jgi:hypothetical protein